MLGKCVFRIGVFCQWTKDFLSLFFIYISSVILWKILFWCQSGWQSAISCVQHFTVPKAMWAFVITWCPLSVCALNFYIFIFSTETASPSWTKLGRKHLQKLLFTISIFCPDQTTNMATTAILVSDWMIFSSPLWSKGGLLMVYPWFLHQFLLLWLCLQ